MTRVQVLGRACAAWGLLLATASSAALASTPLWRVGLAEALPTATGSSWAIEVDPTALAADRLLLDLPGAGAVEARRTELEPRGGDALLWRGRVEGDGGRVVLTAIGERVAGAIWTADGVWEIAPTAAGHQIVRLGELPECGGSPRAPARLVAPDRPERLIGADPVIDVMVLYTPQARVAAGGSAAIEATVRAAVEVTNTAFLDSNMAQRYRLVALGPTDHNDAGNASADLGWLGSDPGVAELRSRFGADLVSLMVETSAGSCGTGYLGPGFTASFQVTARGCAVGNLTWAHEHGHNTGYHHDPANGGVPIAGWRASAYGHWVSETPPPPGGNFRTILSYGGPCPNGCTRVPHFSNPDVLHNERPTGTTDGVCDPTTYQPANPEAWGCRDNRSVGNENDDLVAANFVSVAIFQDGFESGDTAWWSTPSAP